MRLICIGCHEPLESLKKEGFEETFYCRTCGASIMADYDKDNYDQGEND